MVKVALKVTPKSNPATIGVQANLTIVFWPHPQEQGTFEGYVNWFCAMYYFTV